MSGELTQEQKNVRLAILTLASYVHHLVQKADFPKKNDRIVDEINDILNKTK